MGRWDREAEPGLPIKLAPCSNGEFAPRPAPPRLRAAVRMAHDACDQAARRLGMSRRDFLRTSMASAATLLALGACADDGDGGPSSGEFSVPPDATLDRDTATSVLGGDGPIVDVQQHLLEGGGFGSGFPQADCGDGQACFDTEHWLDLVFGRSDTTVAVLSAIPVLTDPDPLSAEVMDAARRAADELCGDGRVLVQGHAQPNVGPLQGALDAMREEAGRYPIAAWKAYTHAGRPWALDDDTGEAFLGLVEEIGPPIVCVHKGLGADPADVGPAAAAHPQLAFVAYHSGHERDVREGPYAAGQPNGGVDRLLESVRRAGVGVGQNVYAELGTTWRNLMGDPDQAAHLLGKLIAALGPGNVLWGTDSIWYGSPQDQIEAFRAFEITAEAQERFGYAPLAPDVKQGILAGNAARLYGIDPAGVPCATSPADREALRRDPPSTDRLLGPRTAAAARRTFAADHPWFATVPPH
ncbi:MAG TPA: amidohydrolase family protein [Acidimicrobiales bacterium]|nr:amidohydrolase family protein [Acidimicrobiales bacterium]